MTPRAGTPPPTPPGKRPVAIGLLFIVATCLSLLAVRPALAESAVVFMYHRFGEDGFPATNIRLEQFEAHLTELKKSKYTVLPLLEILAALRDGSALPDRAIAITVDDAFKSVYTVAWPRLKAAGFPFTLFVSTQPVDKKFAGYMTWDEIRALARDGVTIGNHTVSHLHMPRFDAKRNAAELRISARQLKRELGTAPSIFAYPYGEASTEIMGLVKDAGFTVAFGQHSGVLHAGADTFYLPRFSLNEAYGSMDRFRLAANALPIKVKDITPRDVLLSARTNPPRFGFTVFGDAVPALGRLACYASGQGKVQTSRLGESRIEIRVPRAFPTGRARINCTMPAGGGRWRWYGRQFYVPPR